MSSRDPVRCCCRPARSHGRRSQAGMDGQSRGPNRDLLSEHNPSQGVPLPATEPSHDRQIPSHDRFRTTRLPCGRHARRSQRCSIACSLISQSMEGAAPRLDRRRRRAVRRTTGRTRPAGQLCGRTRLVLPGGKVWWSGLPWGVRHRASPQFMFIHRRDGDNTATTASCRFPCRAETERCIIGHGSLPADVRRPPCLALRRGGGRCRLEAEERGPGQHNCCHEARPS